MQKLKNTTYSPLWLKSVYSDPLRRGPFEKGCRCLLGVTWPVSGPKLGQTRLLLALWGGSGNVQANV
eukprot:1341985-Amphidinium_carterae.1